MVSLNTAQAAAVTSGDGPVLVLAGAGTGKTRVIIERMAWLVEERGVDPRHLLALTFTNKAAAEMRQRLVQRLGLDRLGAWMGTFHSFALFLLRRDIDRLGRKKDFTVFDDADQLSLMKRLVKDLPAGHTKVSPRDALQYITGFKQALETPPELETPDSEEATFQVLWRRYHATLERVSALDFDDLLVFLARLLEEHEDIREKYRRRYRYVHVDEYQDTNHAQYRIARALAGGHGNLFVVGDEDQSIYSWRGADIRNILDFSGDYPDAVVHRLERNYRSTAPILDLANRVVANNRERLGKNLWTDAAKGEAVRFFVADTAEEEAQWVAGDMARSPVPARETAVLYRTNAQARTLEEALRLRGIHYTVVGGIKFYQRKEVKDILAYLRLLVNPDDDEALRRIVNVPARGIGNATMERIEDYAQSRRLPLLQVLRETETDTTFPTRARNAAEALVHLIGELAEKARTEPVAALVEELLERVSYRDYVQHSDERDYKNRLEVVDEFVVGCQQHDTRGGGPLAEYLQDLALMTDVDAWDPDAPAVTLMTAHGAKGLEFEQVYLVGLEEGLFPLLSDFDEGENIEEERRLCYVAMTRARERLTLTAARARMVYGRLRPDREVSRFVGEAGRDRLQLVNTREQRAPARAAAPARADAARIATGTRVRHAKFGPGTVMYTSGSGDKLKARIRFSTGRTMMLMVSKAPLEIAEG